MKIFLKIIGTILIGISAICLVCRFIAHHCPMVVNFGDKPDKD